MSEQRRRRRAAMDGQTGDARHDASTGAGLTPAQEGAAARRRRAQSAQTPAAAPNPQPAKASAAAQAGGARKAVRGAKETAVGLGAMMLLLWQETIAPACAALMERITGRAPDGARGKGEVGGFSRETRRGGAKAAQRGELLRRLMIAALACVACYSLFMIGSILLRTYRTNRLTDELSRIRREAETNTADSGEQAFAIYGATQEPTAAPTAAPTAVPKEAGPAAPTPTPKPPDVVKSTKYHAVGGDALPEMEELYAQNRDLVAWLGIEDVLDLPVVYRDNSYYLNRDFYKNKSDAGTLFLDVNHPFRERTQNLLLHGHNMKDGTMFGRLAQYTQDIAYLKAHAFIDFDTLWRKERYVVFAVLHVSLDVKSDQFFNYYSYPTFSSDAAFESYVRQLQLRSMYAIPVDVQPSDALLTLSTCLDEDRLVIVARRLRDGESRSSLRQVVSLATRQ